MGFSSFRELMDLWDEALNLNDMLSKEEISFYFTKNNEILGTDENGRLTFARMKNPDKEDGKEWLEDASFSAINLTKTIKNHDKTECIINIKDLKEIKVISEEEAKKRLTNVR